MASARKESAAARETALPVVRLHLMESCRSETAGFFIPTARPGLADLQALRDAATKLEAVMLLADEQIEASVRDFDTLRKGVGASRRARK